MENDFFDIKKEIALFIESRERSKRIALSKRFPYFKKLIIYLKCRLRSWQNFFDFQIKSEKREIFFDNIVSRHQSVLRRKLGDSDPDLQEKKITNLKNAIQNLDGIVIQPNRIFSLWEIIGEPKYEDGYVDGMLLSDGKIIAGLGGGLCQLSNFLYWIFLHAPTEIVERHHHSRDVFPDSGRTLPFGSGATILYNFYDLKIKNVSDSPLQLKIWLTDDHLKGQVLSTKAFSEKFHIFEKNHFFVRVKEVYYRYNEIYRESKIAGQIIKTEKITTNFAPVLYEVNDEYLRENNFQVLDFNADSKISK